MTDSNITTLQVIALAMALVIAPVAGLATVPQTTVAAPPGFVGVPGENISSDLPPNTPMAETADAIEAAGVMTDGHADTLEVIVTNPGRAKTKYAGGSLSGGGPVAIVLRDSQNHAGRTVALPRGPLVNVLGHEPGMAYGTHEDGSMWVQPITRDGDWLLVDIPHFSTNTVTFESTVNVTMTGATDGTQTSYELDDLDATDNPSIVLTGVVNSEWDNGSTSVSNTDNWQTSVGGNTQGTANLTFDASGEPIPDSATGSTSGSGGSTTDVSVTFDVPADSTSVSTTVTADQGSSICGSDYGAGANGISASDNHGNSVNLGSTTGNNPTESATLDADPATTTITFTVDSWDAACESFDSLDFTASWDDIEAFGVDNISVNGNQVITGLNESVNQSVVVNVDTGTLNVTRTNQTGTLSITYSIKENTVSKDIGTDVNGNWVNQTGTLASGQSVTLSADKSWLVSGTNRVNVSLPTLSGDSAPMLVDVEYNHTASSDQSVTYEGGQWRESYNVSKTFADNRSSASLKIPFATTVVQIDEAKKRVNGGSWTTVAESDQTLDGTTLTVDLGSVSASDTVEIVVNGSAIDVNNGQITVLDPSRTWQDLNSKIRVDNWNADTYIEVGGTPEGDKIHYVYDESYPGEDEYAVFTSSGMNRLALTAVTSGDTFRVSTHPMKVKAVTGDVRVEVVSMGEEPELDIDPGPGGNGDAVDFTFTNAEDGVTYTLYSKTHGIARDSGTASSPLTLQDDDNKEILQFQKESSSSSGVDGGGSGSSGDSGSDNDVSEGGVIVTDTKSPFGAIPVNVLAVLLALGGLAIVTNRYTGDDLVTLAVVGASALIALAFVPAGNTLDAVLGGLGGAFDSKLLPWFGLIGLVIAGGFVAARATGDGDASSAGDTQAQSSVRLVAEQLAGFGRWLAGTSATTGVALGRAARQAIGLRTVQVGIAGAVIIALFAFDVIVLTSQERVLLLVVTLLLGVFVGLRQTDRFSWPLYGVIAFVAIVFGLNILGTDLLAEIIDSPVFPLVGLGALFLGWQALQSWRQGQTTDITIVGRRGGG